MHPPRFHPSHRLSDWPDCYLETRCPRCTKCTIIAIAMLRRQGPDALILDVVKRLRCEGCKVRAAPVYLCASQHRSVVGGPPPDLALELVRGPR